MELYGVVKDNYTTGIYTSKDEARRALTHHIVSFYSANNPVLVSDDAMHYQVFLNDSIVHYYIEPMILNQPIAL